MNHSIQIIPAILATTEDEYADKLQKIEESKIFDGGWIQIDLMDNKFVQNKSIDSKIVDKYKTDLKIEAQLMVEYPENWIDDLIKARVKRIVFPIEDQEGIEERIAHIKNHGIEAGMSLNPETSVEKVEPFLDKINLVLVMSVNPGFGGQEFIKESIEKIKEISRLRSKNSAAFKIEVDGGVKLDQVKDLIAAGVDNLVMGSYLLEGNIEENVEKIWEIIQA